MIADPQPPSAMLLPTPWIGERACALAAQRYTTSVADASEQFLGRRRRALARLARSGAASHAFADAGLAAHLNI